MCYLISKWFWFDKNTDKLKHRIYMSLSNKDHFRNLSSKTILDLDKEG